RKRTQVGVGLEFLQVNAWRQCGGDLIRGDSGSRAAIYLKGPDQKHECAICNKARDANAIVKQVPRFREKSHQPEAANDADHAWKASPNASRENPQWPKTKQNETEDGHA